MRARGVGGDLASAGKREESLATPVRDPAEEDPPALGATRCTKVQEHVRARIIEVFQALAFEDDVTTKLFEMLSEELRALSREPAHERGT